MLGPLVGAGAPSRARPPPPQLGKETLDAIKKLPPLFDLFSPSQGQLGFSQSPLTSPQPVKPQPIPVPDRRRRSVKRSDSLTLPNVGALLSSSAFSSSAKENTSTSSIVSSRGHAGGSRGGTKKDNLFDSDDDRDYDDSYDRISPRNGKYRRKPMSQREQEETVQYYGLIQSATAKIRECMADYAPDTEDPTSPLGQFRVLRANTSNEDAAIAASAALRSQDNKSTGAGAKQEGPRERVEAILDQISKSERDSVLEEISDYFNKKQKQENADIKRLQLVEVALQENEQEIESQLESMHDTFKDDHSSNATRMSTHIDKLRALIKRLRSEEIRAATNREAMLRGDAASRGDGDTGDGASTSAGNARAQEKGSKTSSRAQSSKGGTSAGTDVASLMELQNVRLQLQIAEAKNLELSEQLKRIHATSGSASGSTTGAAGLDGSTSATTASARMVALIDELQKKLSTSDEKLRTSQNEVQRLTYRLQAIMKMNDNSDVVRELEKEQKLQHERNLQLEATQLQMEAEKRQIEEEGLKQATATKKLKLRLDIMKAEMDALQKRYDDERSQCAKAKKLIKALEGKLREFTQQRAGENAASQAHTADAVAAAQQEAEAAVTEASSEAAMLKQRVESLEAEVVSLKAARDAALEAADAAAVAASPTEIADAFADVATAEEKGKSRSPSPKKGAGTQSSKSSAKGGAASNTKPARDPSSTKPKVAASTQSSSKDKEAATLALELEIAQANEQISKLQNQLRQREKDASDKDKERLRADKENTKNSTSLAVTSKKLSESEAHAKTLGAQVINLMAEVADLKAKLDKANRAASLATARAMVANTMSQPLVQEKSQPQQSTQQSQPTVSSPPQKSESLLSSQQQTQLPVSSKVSEHSNAAAERTENAIEASGTKEVDAVPLDSAATPEDTEASATGAESSSTNDRELDAEEHVENVHHTESRTRSTEEDTEKDGRTGGGGGGDGDPAADDSAFADELIRERDNLSEELEEKMAVLAASQTLLFKLQQSKESAASDLQKLSEDFTGVQTMLSQYSAERLALQDRLAKALSELTSAKLEHRAEVESMRQAAEEGQAIKDAIARRGAFKKKTKKGNATLENEDGEGRDEDTQEIDEEQQAVIDADEDFPSEAVISMQRDITRLTTENASLSERLLKEGVIDDLKKELLNVREEITQRNAELAKSMLACKRWEAKYNDLMNRFQELVGRASELDDLRRRGIVVDGDAVRAAAAGTQEVLMEQLAAASVAAGPSGRRGTGENEQLLAVAMEVQRVADESKKVEDVKAKRSIIKPFPTRQLRSGMAHAGSDTQHANASQPTTNARSIARDGTISGSERAGGSEGHHLQHDPHAAAAVAAQASALRQQAVQATSEYKSVFDQLKQLGKTGAGTPAFGVPAIDAVSFSKAAGHKGASFMQEQQRTSLSLQRGSLSAREAAREAHQEHATTSDFGELAGNGNGAGSNPKTSSYSSVLQMLAKSGALRDHNNPEGSAGAVDSSSGDHSRFASKTAFSLSTIFAKRQAPGSLKASSFSLGGSHSLADSARALPLAASGLHSGAEHGSGKDVAHASIEEHGKRGTSGAINLYSLQLTNQYDK